MSQFTTGFAGAADKQGLIDLQDSVGGGYATSEDFDHWRLDHPGGEVTVPVVRTREGSLAGAVWIFPMQISAGEETFNVRQVANLHVDPRYRDTFAYVALTRHLGRTLKRSTPLHFSLPSVQIFERQQESDSAAVARAPWLLKVFDSKGLAQHLAHGEGLPPIGATTLLAALQRRTQGRSTRPLSPSVSVELVREFGDRFDAFWATARLGRSVAMIRDRAYLEWRFSGLRLKSYEMFVANIAGDMAGYLVLRKMTESPVAYVMDFLVADGPHSAAAAAALLGAAEDECRAHHICALSTSIAPASREASLIAASGFSLNPLRHIDRFGSLWPSPLRYAVSTHDGDAISAATHRAANWYVSLAHHETL